MAKGGKVAEDEENIEPCDTSSSDGIEIIDAPILVADRSSKQPSNIIDCESMDVGSSFDLMRYHVLPSCQSRPE